MRKSLSYIRRCLALGFMLSGMCTLLHAQGKQQGTLYIEKRDGTTIKLPITPGYPQLNSKEEGAYLEIQKNETEVEYMTSADILRIYATLETSGIASLTTEEDGMQPATVYAIDGTQVGTDSQNLEQLPKGIYIIKKGKQSTKYVRP